MLSGNVALAQEKLQQYIRSDGNHPKERLDLAKAMLEVMEQVQPGLSPIRPPSPTTAVSGVSDDLNAEQDGLGKLRTRPAWACQRSGSHSPVALPRDHEVSDILLFTFEGSRPRTNRRRETQASFSSV